jgi:hypothetical protein
MPFWKLNKHMIIQHEEQEQEHILYWFEHRFLTKWLHSIRCGEKYNKYVRGYILTKCTVLRNTTT